MKKKDILNYFYSRNKKIYTLQNRSRDDLGENEVKNFEFLIKRIFKPQSTDKKILDVGSGDKFLKKPFQNRGYKYFDIDIDSIDFNSEKFPYDDNTFDFIISLAVIEHINNPGYFVSEINRVLKAGGILFLSTPNWTYSYKNFYDDYTHVRPYSKMTIKRLLIDNKFKDINVIPGLRNKPFWMYKIPCAFYFASLIPFTNDVSIFPNFLKGKATSIFAIARK